MDGGKAGGMGRSEPPQGPMPGLRGNSPGPALGIVKNACPDGQQECLPGWARWGPADDGELSRRRVRDIPPGCAARAVRARLTRGVKRGSRGAESETAAQRMGGSLPVPAARIVGGMRMGGAGIEPATYGL